MAILKRHKSSIAGLVSDLEAINQAIADEATARGTADGDLATLNTQAKSSLVAAINEVVGSVSDTAGAALQKSANLGDLQDAGIARTNLDVLSSTEVADQITAAQLNMGSNFNVANLTERDALADLDTADRVFVIDDGDGKWAMYKPTAFDEVTGLATSWTKLSDQDSLENSINGAAIKASYEGNDDTNAYTDADKAKVGLLSVTQAIDLDDAVLKAGLAQDLAVAAPADNAPSAAAVKTYADEAAKQGGSLPALESLVVAVGGQITLTNAPKGGLAGVMNFGTVRYMSAEGIAYDAPLVATADPKVFTISTDSANQWDGNTVQVQYLYVAG
jgi:hypothetical protein